jgi:hypothetical protein
MLKVGQGGRISDASDHDTGLKGLRARTAANATLATMPVFLRSEKRAYILCSCESASIVRAGGDRRKLGGISSRCTVAVSDSAFELGVVWCAEVELVRGRDWSGCSAAAGEAPEVWSTIVDASQSGRSG